VNAIGRRIRREDADRVKPNWMIVAGMLAGVYAVLATAANDYRVTLLLLAAPMMLVGLVLKNSARVYLIVLVISLTFGARFRFGGIEFHQGGAEASLAPIDFPLVGLLLIGLSQFAARPKAALRLTPIGMAFLLFVAVHVVSVFAAYDSSLALLELFRLLKMGLLVLIIRHYVQARNDLLLVLAVLFGTMMAQGVLSVSKAFFNTSLGLGFLGEHEALLTQEAQGFVFGRVGGTLGHANVLGYFFEMTLPIALAIFLWSDRGRLKALSFGALGLGLFGVFLTYSRASWVAALIGLSAVVLATALLRQRHRAWIRPILLVLLVVVVIGLAFRETIFQRLNLFGSASWDFRLETFQIAWNLIQAQPLFGVGANNYLAVIQACGYASIIPLAVQAPAHNLLLLMGAETGLFGVIAFAILLIHIGDRAYRAAKGGPDLIAAGAIGILAGIAALMAHSMLDWLFRFDSIYTLFWFEVGLLLSMRSISERQGLGPVAASRSTG